MGKKRKGIHDIITHSDLDRPRSPRRVFFLFGFGNPPGLARRKDAPRKDWEGKIEEHLYKKKKGDNSGNYAKKQFYLEEERRMQEIIYFLKREIDDLSDFTAEALPGVEKELQKLKSKLDRYQDYLNRLMG